MTYWLLHYVLNLLFYINICCFIT